MQERQMFERIFGKAGSLMFGQLAAIEVKARTLPTHTYSH